MRIDSEDLLSRFLRYVQVETRSDPHSSTTPSTPGQWVLLRMLADELREIGAVDVQLTDKGIVLATLPPSPAECQCPTIAWFAHVDTATNLPGGASPIVHRSYAGGPIVFPDRTDLQLTVENTPGLREAIGQDIVTASGRTLLGADDKAGVAVVMAAARHLLQNPQLPHGRIRLCFNPDEEIARGMHALDLGELAAQVGYTLDGGVTGEINFETFSADAAVLEIEGVAAHPGWAKNVLVNALRLAARFVAALPTDEAPETTDGRAGFIHPVELTGSAERAVVRLILRDFELDGLAAKRATLERIAAELRRNEPRARVALTFTEQYRNMRYGLERDMRPVEFAALAMQRAGVTPRFETIRGGTDGSNLTARGLPTPNLFVGMHEVHSEREWVSVQDMTKAAEVLVHLAAIWTESSANA